MDSGIICLGSQVGEKAMLLCMVTKDLAGKFNAGEIVKEIAPIVGGSGGADPTWPRPAAPNPKYRQGSEESEGPFKGRKKSSQKEKK